MSEHIGFNEERRVERGEKLTDEQKKHVKNCLPCKLRLDGTTKRVSPASAPEPSRWQRFLSGLKSVFTRKKSP